MIGFVAGLLVTASVIAAILLAAGAVLYLLGLVAVGLVVGGLGRLVLPGQDPMGPAITVVVGIGGSFLGGLLGWFALRGSSGIVLSVAGGALMVWLIRRPVAAGPPARGRRRP